MDFETFEAIVADGGGYDNITCLVFDNSILVNFITKSEGKCKESDFVKLGSEYCYKEHTKFRSNDNYTYDVDHTIYHPLSCLQAVLMGDSSRLDIASFNSLLH